MEVKREIIEIDTIVELTRRMKIYHGCEILFKYGKRADSINLKSGQQASETLQEILDKKPRNKNKIGSFRSAK